MSHFSGCPSGAFVSPVIWMEEPTSPLVSFLPHSDKKQSLSEGLLGLDIVY